VGTSTTGATPRGRHRHRQRAAPQLLGGLAGPRGTNTEGRIWRTAPRRIGRRSTIASPDESSAKTVSHTRGSATTRALLTEWDAALATERNRPRSRTESGDLRGRGRLWCEPGSSPSVAASGVSTASRSAGGCAPSAIRVSGQRWGGLVTRGRALDRAEARPGGGRMRFRIGTLDHIPKEWCEG
jgi:hypothetical protein